MSPSVADLALEQLSLDYAALEDQWIAALADAVTYRWLYLTVFVEWGKQLDRANNFDRQLRALFDVDRPA